jgi:ADP-heptose:LPS heptosyltransferase
MNIKNVKSLLIIKHGALGDIIKALGVCRVLRRYYPKAQITLLTSQPYASICRETGYFDQILMDPRSWNLLTTVLILKALARHKYDFVIDFQNSRRTNRYFKIWQMLSDSPWCGTAKKCQYPIDMALKEQVHIYDRFYYQLQLLGIDVDRESMAPTLEWLPSTPVLHLNSSKYVILIPGSSSVALNKRWPVESYTQIAIYLAHHGIIPVIIGGEEEKRLATLIMKGCPQACDLTQQTSLIDIGNLAKDAIAIIGNDTGPTYFTSAAGKPTIVLWSDYSNPLIHAPRGEHITVLQQNCLADLSVERVIDVLKPLLHS